MRDRDRHTMFVLARAVAAAAAGVVIVAAAPAPARGADLLRDDFNGAALDQSKWGIGTWLLGRTQLAFTPQVTGGMARLRLDTYNPTNTSLLRGTEILSDLSFTRGSGIEYEARVRTNAVAPGGTVTSFFTYTADTSLSPPLADEIDFEFLSKHINASPGPSDPVLATTWNNFRTDGSNFGDPNVHTSVRVDVPNLNLATFNTFKIRWLPDRVQWFVNDVPIRTSKFAVPDMPAPIRANFWAPNTDWGDAYSAALQPVNNAGANTTWLYDIDHIAVRRVFDGVAATSPGRVFTDTFRNGSVANSDASAGFWAQRNQGAGSSVAETNAPPAHAAEPLKLRAAGAGYPHAQIVSGVRGEFNLFKTPLAIEASGVGFSSTSHSTTVNTIGKSILRFSLAPGTLGSGAESEYTAADALSLRIEGTNLVALGYKLDAPNANSEYNVNLLSQAVSGPVRRVKLIAHGSFYRLEVGHDLSETDSRQTTSNFSGALSLDLAAWNASGDAAMFVQGQLNNAGANENMTALVEGLAVSAVRPAWSPPDGAAGSWNSDANWDWQIAPNFRGAHAQFTNQTSAAQAVTIDAPVTTGAITFDNPQSYAINGTGAAGITLETYVGNARIEVLAGAHTIAAPVAVLRPLDLHVASGAKLTLAGEVAAAGRVVTKTGGGAAEVRNVRAAGLAVDAGTVRVLDDGSAASTSVLTNLAVAAGATFDLRDNDLVLRSTAPGAFAGGAYTGVSALLADGRLMTTAGGDSLASTGLGVALAADALGIGPTETAEWSGQVVTGADTLVKYTYIGDTNLDGAIDADDYGTIDFAVLVPGASGYYNGDFNFDGVINADDYGYIDFNILAQGPPLTTSGGGAAAAGAVAAVPEPASIAGLGCAAATWMRRRRQQRG